MGKYEALGAYLREYGGEHVRLTFKEVERITGSNLPPSKKYPAWWSNNPSNNVMTRVWMDAGYRSEQVDVEGQALTFRRVALCRDGSSGGGSSAPQSGALEKGVASNLEDVKHPRRHPAFGALKDVTWIAPDVDLTEPADPEWVHTVEDLDWRP